MTSIPSSIPDVGAVVKTVRLWTVEPAYVNVILEVITGVIPALVDAGVATIVCPGVVPVAGIDKDVILEPPK